MDGEAPRGPLRFLDEIQDPRMDRTKLHLLSDMVTVHGSSLVPEGLCIDIGRPSRAFPVTPPGIRVRTTAVRIG